MPALPLLTRKAGIFISKASTALPILPPYITLTYSLSMFFPLLTFHLAPQDIHPSSQDVNQTQAIYQAEYYKKPKKLLSFICFVHFLLLFLAKPDTFSKFAS